MIAADVGPDVGGYGPEGAPYESKEIKQMAKSRKDLQDVREKVTGKVEDLAAKAEAKGLTREHAAEVRDDLRAKGEKVLNDPARRNKAGVAITAAAAAVVAVVLAGWRIIRRRRSE